MSHDLNLVAFRKALPKRMTPYVNQNMIDEINAVMNNSDIREEFKDNMYTYASILADGKFKMESYVHAIRYVTHKLLGSTNIDAWVKTFPDRYQGFLARGICQADIESRVSAYNRGILVNKIMEQTLIPTHILNQGLHQRAINQLAHLMMNARSEKVQSDSAAKLVDALKMPETQKIELDIGLKEDNSIKELRETTLALVRQQREMLDLGVMTVKEVAHSKLSIVDGECEITEDTGT